MSRGGFDSPTFCSWTQIKTEGPRTNIQGIFNVIYITDTVFSLLNA